MAESDPFPGFDTQFPIGGFNPNDPPQGYDPFPEIQQGAKGTPGGKTDGFPNEQLDGWEHVQMKASVKFADDGETEFTDNRTGWVLWRRLDGSTSSGFSSSFSSGSSSSSTSSSSAASSAPGSSGSSAPSGSSGSQSSAKDSAIVEASWSDTGFVALYTMEAPDVRFEETVVDVKIDGRITSKLIDGRFVEVVEAETMRVVSACCDRPFPVGARIENHRIIIESLPFKCLRPKTVNIRITAIRKGFLGVRFTPKTLAEFLANEERLRLDTGSFENTVLDQS